MVDRKSLVSLYKPPKAELLYTLDGSLPSDYNPETFQYHPEQGVVLKAPGLCFIRAIATSHQAVSSDIFTSRRFWVLRGIPADSDSEAEYEDKVCCKDYLLSYPGLEKNENID